MVDHLQVENGQLTDYEGTYARFLEKNAGEAAKMGVKEQKKKELEKSQIKAKSKVSNPAEHHARDAVHCRALELNSCDVIVYTFWYFGQG